MSMTTVAAIAAAAATLSRKQRRRTTVSPIPQAVYLGLELEYNNENKRIDYAICVHDGFYAINYEISWIGMDIEEAEKDKSILEAKLDSMIKHITNYTAIHNYKINAIGLGTHVNGTEKKRWKNLLRSSPSLASKLWLQLDALPFLIVTKGKSLDERASSAVRKAVVW